MNKRILVSHIYHQYSKVIDNNLGDCILQSAFVHIDSKHRCFPIIGECLILVMVKKADVGL